MIAAILFFFLFLVIVIPYGWGTVRGLHRVLAISEPLPALPWLVVAGLVSVTTLAALLSIVMPLGILAFGILLGGALILGFLGLQTDRDAIRTITLPGWRHWTLAWLALIVLTVLHNAIFAPSNSDTGLYHAQAIRWMEYYPAVPGLGNLHGRFAYNSHWLVANAIFSLAFLGLRSFHLLPSAFFLVVMLFCFGGALAWLNGQRTTANVLKALIIPLAFYTLGSEISSPGTDLPAILLTWLVAVLWLEMHEEGNATSETHHALLVILPAFALTIKLSTAPLLLFSLLGFWPWVRRKAFRQPLVLTAIVLLVLFPWVIRNVIISGYVVYPQTLIDLFNVDWKIPLSRAAAEQNGVLGWSRVPGIDPAISTKMPFSEWFPLWLARLTTGRTLSFFTAALAPVLVGGGLAFLRSKKFYNTLVPLTVAAYAGFLFWLGSAPDFRFGYGFIILLLLIPAYLMIEIIQTRVKRPHTLVFILLAAFTLYQGYFLIKSFNFNGIREYLLLPAIYQKYPTMECQIKNAAIRVAEEGKQCGYRDFPCAPTCRPSLELRGSDWGDGFRITQEDLTP
jgi:hypothetical protein